MKFWFKKIVEKEVEQKKACPLVLFLDFDGVLHPFQRGTFEFVKNFQSILDVFPEAKVVISSSWRLTYNIEELREYFEEPYQHRVIGVTPFSENGNRDAEILMYLLENPSNLFLAIDDEDKLFKTKPSWLHLVPSGEGLNTHQTELLLERLKKETCKIKSYV